MAEGGGLLNRYRLVKAYRGFESLRLRQFGANICGESHILQILPTLEPTLTTGFRWATALPLHAIALLLDVASTTLGQLAARIAGDDWR